MEKCTLDDVSVNFSPSEFEEISEELKRLGVKFRVTFNAPEKNYVVSVHYNDYVRFEEARYNVELQQEALQKAENERKIAENNIKQQEIQRQEQIRKELEIKAQKTLKRRKEYER
jgi:hypothetical protein